MAIIGFLIFGAIVGAIARLIKPGRQNLSFLATLGLGVVGSLVAGVIANAIGTGSWDELDWIGSIIAIVVAFLLIGTAEKLTGDKKV